MKVIRTAISDVLVIEPNVFSDARGFFCESWNARAFAAAGIRTEFGDIEGEIRTAIIGTPKKAAESAFSQARRQITADINNILAVDPPPSPPCTRR